MNAQVLPIDTASLGDRSYLVHDGELAVVVDPQRDIDRVLDLAGREQVRISTVFETHLHNDYVSGGLALARATGARYLLSAEDEVAFDHVRLHDGATVRVGALTVRALHTPGHTFSHLSYLVELGGHVIGAFTGGSLLYGATGRPDLLGAAATPVLARAQYRSAHRLAAELPTQTPLYPTHGFGSFCSSTQSEADSSTLARELQVNDALTLAEDAYVTRLLEGLGAYPAYYAHMAPINRLGPAPVDLTPPPSADPQEVRRRLDAGEWLVDLRTRTGYARGHLPGSVNIGLDGAMSNYLGWLLPWGTPVTLLGETAEQVAQAQRELVRIGIDRPAAAATGEPATWTGGPLGRYPIAGFAAVPAAPAGRGVTVLDVRRVEEWRESHLAAALHIPLHELPARLAEVPPAPTEIWVHCETGYRSAIAASLLARAGRRVVLIDDQYTTAQDLGLTVSPSQPVAVTR